MLKYSHEKEKATRITVSLEGDVQKYALSFLHIWNNAREYPNMFYRVENNSGNNVYVTCRTEDAESITEYLDQFGEIVYTEEINWFIIRADMDMRGWNELFGDDCDADFTEEID